MGFNATNIDIITNESPSLIKLGEIAAKIALNNYEWRYNTFVIFNAILVSTEVFFKNYNAVVVKRGKFVPVIQVDHVPQFVIFGEHFKELIDMLTWILHYKYDNTARYIIVCVASTVDCDEKMLVESLGDNRITNVVYLKLSNDYTPEAYTIYPFRPNKCWNKEPVKIDELIYNCENDACYRNLYPEKYHNLYKCPFSVSTYEQPPYMTFVNNSDGGLEPAGADGYILNLIINMLNGTLDVKIPAEAEWGHFVNNNWTGCLGEVFNGRANAAMCSCPLTVAKYGNFQISFAYGSMDMVWGASIPARKPSWEKLLYPLPLALRIIMLVMFMAIVFINAFTKTKFWHDFMDVLQSKPTRSNLLIHSWVIFLGMPVFKLPEKSMFRLIVSSWIWYCVIIRSVYQATLVGSLKLRTYDNKIENFSEVLARKYPFGGQQTLREYYSEERNIYEKWQDITQAETTDTLDKISTGDSYFVMAINKESIYSYLLDYHGTRRIQVLPEKIVNSPTVMFFKKKTHLCATVSRLLTVYLEAGYTERLQKNYMTYVKNLLFQPTSHAAEPLLLEHFTGSFIILILGWLLASIFFIIEFICGHKYKNK